MQRPHAFGPQWVAASVLFLGVSAQALEPREVFLKAAPSMVTVAGKLNEGRFTTGNGVALRADMVLTDCRALAPAPLVTVRSDERVYTARLVAEDRLHNLCLLKVVNAKLRSATLATRAQVVPGDRIFAIESPNGDERTLSEGIVNGLRKFPDGEFIQTSAGISKGAYGVGLFNAEGELIGLSASYALGQDDNIKFAWRIDFAVALLAKTEQSENATAQVATPQRTFASSEEERQAYLRWRSASSERLKSRQPEQAARLAFLEALWFESRRAGLEPALVLAIVDTMSGFRKYTVNANGAVGFMQVAPAWARIIGDGDVARLFHTQANLRFGCTIVRHYLDESDGDLFTALVRYYGQSQTKEVALDDPLGVDYAQAVMSARRTWVVAGG